MLNFMHKGGASSVWMIFINYLLKKSRSRVKQLLQGKINFLRNHLQMLSSPKEQQAQQVIEDLATNTATLFNRLRNWQTAGHYQAMPKLSLIQAVEPFDLLLCADLFFQANKPSAISTQDLMNELCAIATEVRIFPISEKKEVITTELGPLMLILQQRNFGVEVKAVNFPQRSNGHAMLRIWAKECGIRLTEQFLFNLTLKIP